MKDTLRLITFDVYSALFDLDATLVPALTRVLEAQVDCVSLLRAWRKKQLEYLLISNSLQRERVPFRVVTRRALDHALRGVGRAVAEAARQELVEAWNHLRLWPEADQVLARVRVEGYLLGVLSNGDEAMLRSLLASVAVPVDHVFASDQAGYYKPHPAIYALPLRTVGLTGPQVLHVAGSATDTLGAKAAGLRCAWSNRRGDYLLDPAVQPDFEWPDLTGLLSIL